MAFGKTPVVGSAIDNLRIGPVGRTTGNNLLSQDDLFTNVEGWASIQVWISATSGISAGAVTFEISPDRRSWFPLPMAEVAAGAGSAASTVTITTSRTFAANINAAAFRVRASTNFEGGSVQVLATLSEEAIVLSGSGGGGGGGGDASAANQVAGNSTLTAINNKIPAIGVASAASASPVSLSQVDIFSGGSGRTTGNNLLTADNSALACTSYRHAQVWIVASSGIGGGQVTFEHSPDGTNWFPWNVRELTTSVVATASSVLAITASTSRCFGGPIAAAAIRVRVNSNIVGGTVQAWASLSQTPFTDLTQASVSVNQVAGQTVTTGNLPVALNQIGAGGTASISTFANNSSLGVYAAGIFASTMVTSAARTSNGNSGFLSSNEGAVQSAGVSVTAISGSGATLRLFLEESLDNGTTWIVRYQLADITATGFYYFPAIEIFGRTQIRWVISGGTPSITFSVTRNGSGFKASSLARQFFDYTPGLLSGTLNAVSSAYDLEGCSLICAYISLGAAATPGIYRLQVSGDGSAWCNASDAVVGAANAVTPIIATAGVIGRLWRVICTSAATSQTGNYVQINGSN